MALLVIHLWGKFWMAAWRGRRTWTWITGVVAFAASVVECFTGYLSQQERFAASRAPQPWTAPPVTTSEACPVTDCARWPSPEGADGLDVRPSGGPAERVPGTAGRRPVIHDRARVRVLLRLQGS
jgi:hypothetical protein